jgi:sigma-E factor negative regulatory protein RseA
MTDPVKEQLSACLDGELPEAELDLLLKQLHHDPRLQQSAGRYALVGEVLRSGGGTVIPSAGFASRISQAIAAGVAALAVMVLQPQLPDSSQVAQTQEPATAAAAQQPGSDRYIVPTTTSTPQLVPPTSLAKYVMAHAEFAGSPFGRPATLSSVLSDDGSEMSETVDITTPADSSDSTEPQP